MYQVSWPNLLPAQTYPSPRSNMFYLPLCINSIFNWGSALSSRRILFVFSSWVWIAFGIMSDGGSSLLPNICSHVSPPSHSSKPTNQLLLQYIQRTHRRVPRRDQYFLSVSLLSCWWVVMRWGIWLMYNKVIMDIHHDFTLFISRHIMINRCTTINYRHILARRSLLTINILIW